jgi:hypothetical protein
MALTERQKRTRNAEYQARWREKREALVKANPEVAERALLEEAEECEQLSDAERIALADKLADMAMSLLHRSQELARVAMRVRHR